MSGKIRRCTLSVNGEAQPALVNIDWQDAYEFDRRGTDEEMAGDPVKMKESGSGSIELLKGNVNTGYGTADMVATYKEATVAAGVETVASKTVTFTKVTFNSGGSIDNDAGPGSRRISFDYGTSVTADVA